MRNLKPFNLICDLQDANIFILKAATLIGVLMGVKAEILLDREV